MDKTNEMNCIMVNSSLFATTVISTALICSAYGENITNISQCLNVHLTADVLRGFPTNSTSSVQNCVLVFVKGSVNGSLKTFASSFSEEIRSSEFGFSDLDNIPIAVSDEFATLIASVSNCVTKVVSYCEITNKGFVKANITLHRQGECYNRDEVTHLDIVQTNNVWSIINWDVDE